MSRFVCAIVIFFLPFPLPGAEGEKEAARLARPNVTSPVTQRSLRLVGSISSSDDVRGKLTGAAPQTQPQSDTLRLTKPNSVAVDKAGRIFVADPTHRGILVFDRQAQTLVRWTGNNQYPLFGPAGIAFDGDGRLFVTDVYKADVVVFDTAGTPVAVFGKEVLKRPEGIAIDTQRARIYVGDMRLHQVASFDLRTFVPGQVIGPSESGDSPDASRLFAPGNIALDSKGQLYVSDASTCRVHVFAPGSALLRAFNTPCGRQAGPGRPIAISSDDRVYVADAEDETIQRVEANGKAIVLAAPAVKAQSSRFVRTGLAVDGENRLYVAEQGPDQGRVQIFEQRRGSKQRAERVPDGTRQK